MERLALCPGFDPDQNKQALGSASDDNCKLRSILRSFLKMLARYFVTGTNIAWPLELITLYSGSFLQTLKSNACIR